MGTALYQTNQSIPKDMLLGNLLFTTLTDMTIPENDLISIFQKNQIPESYVRKISYSDAYRRASSSIKNRIVYMNNVNGGVDKVRIEVDEVKSDTDGIKRIIGVKKVDEIAEDIKYQPIGEIIFNRSNNFCSATPFLAPGDADFQTFRDLCNEVENKYQEWSVFHNKDTVKNIINRIISDTHPVNLMPTGLCKFIPSNSMDLLYHLKDALNEMSVYSSNKSENVIEIIPVIDTDEQRNLIEKNFVSEITTELFDFTQELKDVLSKKATLSTRSAASYIEKFNTLKEKAQEYENLLGTYVGAIYTQITEALDLVDANKDD